jgi:ferrous iron transport protein B
VAPSAYFLGVVSIIVSGIILKKSKMFSGDPAPFVMELPAYHLPTVSNILRSMWERAWSFIKKAGTIILLATILVWFLSYFGFVDGHFQMLTEDQMDSSILGVVGSAICWIFMPQGFGNWQFTVATITGLIAKENVIGTLGILFGGGATSVYETMAATVTPVAAYAYLAFNLLCAPCFAAIGAMRREMNSHKWTWFAIGYQCGFAYIISLIIYQLGMLFSGNGNPVGTVVAIVLVVLLLVLLFRPEKRGGESRSAVSQASVST